MDFSQLIGENRIYEQQVINDVIIGANWDINPSGPVLTPLPPGQFAADCGVLFVQHGSFVLTCTLNCASGQVLKGQVRVNASGFLV